MGVILSPNKKPHINPCESVIPPHIGREGGFHASTMLRKNAR